MTEAAHSKFSASAASRWLSCPGSMVLSAGLAEVSSVYAAWGTVAHDIADQCIGQPDAAPAGFLGTTWHQDGHTITVDQDMVDCVNTYLANLREMTVAADILTGEMRVNYAEWLGVPRDSAWGTADAIAVVGTELQVHDLKTGMGVEVDAEGNEQMMLYAGGALLEYQDLADIQSVRMVIHQPRIKKAPSEWSINVDELKAWLTGRARSGAASVQNAENMSSVQTLWAETYLHPTEKGCRWCKAKATCPALRNEVAETVMHQAPASPDEFESYVDKARAMGACATTLESVLACEKSQGHSATAWLSAALSKVDLIEDWCKAVRAEVERRLLAGEGVPGYKLVQGKRGARQWTDEEQAEAMLKTFRLKTEDMYQFKVISPTATDKLIESGAIGPRQAPKLKALIVQKDGKPHVCPMSDKRPALEIKPVADDFETTTDDLV